MSIATGNLYRQKSPPPMTPASRQGCAKCHSERGAAKNNIKTNPILRTDEESTESRISYQL
jgi:hypothetical protein